MQRVGSSQRMSLEQASRPRSNGVPLRDAAAEARGDREQVVTGHVQVAFSEHYQGKFDRLAGDLLLTTGGDADDVAARYHCALAIAREQGARSFELRAATSLARLLRDQGKRAEARALLAPIYDWSTEGFDTRDLVEAKTLLDELGGP